MALAEKHTAVSKIRSGHDRPGSIVPPRTVAGAALTLVIAIMSCLACLAIGTVTIVDQAAENWQSDIAAEITIEIPAGDPDNLDRRIASALEAARGAAGIGAVRIVDQSETRALLEPWLGDLQALSDGAGDLLAELPVPTLIALEVTDRTALDTEALSEALIAAVPGAVLDDHQVWNERLANMAGAMVVAGALVLALILTATVLCVVFATRSAMASNKDVVEVLHFVGASHAFVAGEFQRHFLFLGLRGGLIGGAMAMLVFLAFHLFVDLGSGSAAANQVNALIGVPRIGFNGYAGCVALVFLIAFLTAGTSRVTVRRFLRAA